MKSQIKKMESGKSCGQDKICNEIIKNSNSIMLTTLAKLFKLILITEKYPDVGISYLLYPYIKMEITLTHQIVGASL